MNDEQRQFLQDLRTAQPDLKNVNDDLTLDLALGAASRNEAAVVAWETRQDDPRAWGSAARSLAGEVAAKALGPRRGSAMTTAEEDTKAMSMSDAEFAAHWHRTTRTRI